MFAGTVVVSERGRKPSPPPVMPPPLAWWAASLQLSGLSAEHADLARQFLARAPQLDPRLRDQMMCTDDRGRVVARISPPPPPGNPAAVLLAAVLAERHRRELIRLGAAGPAQTVAAPVAVPPPAGAGTTTTAVGRIRPARLTAEP